MSKPLLGLALAALGGFFLLMSSMARPAVSAPGDCTMLAGYSVTRDVFTTGGLETQPGIVNGEWELLMDGGASVNRIAYSGWLWDQWDADNITSRCTVNGRLPTSIIFNLGYRFDSEVGQVQPVLDAVALIRQRINPNATIYLMGQVGSTTPETCDIFSDNVSQGSIDALRGAIAVDPTLREAVHPKVLCSQYIDFAGHLNSAGGANAASQVAAWWASLGGTPAPTPTATPTPTPTPVPTLVSCERVATYSNGSKVTTALPLGDC